MSHSKNVLSALKKREEGALTNQKHFKQVSNLRFYAQKPTSYS